MRRCGNREDWEELSEYAERYKCSNNAHQSLMTDEHCSLYPESIIVDLLLSYVITH